MAAAAGAVVAPGAVGWANTQVVTDPEGDAAEPSCDIVKTTAGHGKHGRLKHTVTTAEPALDPTYPGQVFIKTKRNDSADFALLITPGADGVKTSFSNGRRTVVYTFKKSAIEGLGKKSKYYWTTGSYCMFNGDYVPAEPLQGNRYKAHSVRPKPRR